MLIVLRRRPHHTWAADVDVLDDLIEGRTACHRPFEGIKIDDHQIDGNDFMLFQLGDVFRVVSKGENSTMNSRVKRLYPAVHHFRKARDLGNILDGNSVVAQQRSRAATGSDRNTQGGQGPGEFYDAFLVRNADQGSLNPGHCWYSS